MTEQLAKPIPPVPATEGCYFIPCGHCSCALVGDDGGNAYCHPCSLVARVRELEQALRMLYEEDADYIRVNHLGEVNHNQAMYMAWNALQVTDKAAKNG